MIVLLHVYLQFKYLMRIYFLMLKGRGGGISCCCCCCCSALFFQMSGLWALNAVTRPHVTLSMPQRRDGEHRIRCQMTLGSNLASPAGCLV